MRCGQANAKRGKLQNATRLAGALTILGAVRQRQESADQAWKILEPVQNGVRAKLFGPHACVAKSNRKDRDASSPRGSDIGLAIPDHDGKPQVSARPRNELCDMARVRLVETERIPPRFCVEERARAES